MFPPVPIAPATVSAYEKALLARDAVEVAEVLETTPRVVDTLREGPVLLEGLPRAVRDLNALVPEPSVPALARLLAHPDAVIDRLQSLNRFEFQLVGLAQHHGGRLTLEQAIDEVGFEHADALERAAETVCRRLLGERDSAWLTLLPEVGRRIGFPGVPLRHYADSLTVPDLKAILARLGTVPRVQRKAALIDDLESALRDRPTIEAAIGRLDPEAVSLLHTLVEAGGTMPSDEVADLLDLHASFAYYFSPVPRRHDYVYGGSTTVVHQLSQCGLAGVDGYHEVVFVPLDVIVTLQGGLYPNWNPDPVVTPAGIGGELATLPSLLGIVDELLHRLARTPAAGLKAGGIGVREIRSLAKAMGKAPGEVGLAAALAIESDLLGSVVREEGGSTRGGRRKVAITWTTTAHVERYQTQPPAARWASLVACAMHSTVLDESEGLPERVELNDALDLRNAALRRAILTTLLDLPAGQGLDRDDLLALLDHHHPTKPVALGLEHRIACLHLLGLVPASGPVGLTALGRALLTEGVAAVEAQLPAPERHFVVQPDHSVIAPPGLAADLASTLQRYATPESAGGATILRLDETRIAQAIDAGEQAEGILAFLTEHSSVPVPQNVEVFVTDVARRHGRLRVGTASSYVISDDPVVLADALRVRPAKLRRIAPTVAVSSLSRTKLMDALAAKGLMPVAEDASGARLSVSRTLADPEALTLGPLDLPSGGLLAARHSSSDLLALADEVLAAPDRRAMRAPRGSGGRSSR